MNTQSNTQTLHVIRSETSNRYCVPAALSALTGRHVDDIEKEIREFIGDQPLTGVFSGVAIVLLKRWGYRPREIPIYGTHVLTLMKYKGLGYPLLVAIHGHILVLHCGQVIDSLYPNGVAVSEYHYRNNQVEQAWEVIPPSEVSK